MVAGEHIVVNRIEHVPHAAPDEYEPEGDREVVPEITNEVFVRRSVVVLIKVLIHSTSITPRFLLVECA